MKEIRYDTDFPVKGLSLMISCGCNLDCKYCKIAQARHNNPHANELQLKTINSLKDGSFIETTKKALSALNQSAKNIDTIAFWGQEPTLTLDLITNDLPHWFEVFPNWKGSFFSTNTVDYIDKIYDYICAMDKYTPRPFEIKVQFSYDGEYGTTNARGTSGSVIYNNIITLLEKLNNITLKNVQCEFNFHGVISQDLVMRMQQDPQEIINYYQNILDCDSFFMQHNRNNKVWCSNSVDLALETPLQASSYFGTTLASVLRTSGRLHPNNFTVTSDKGEYDSLVDRLSEGAYVVFDMIIKSLREELNTDNLNDAIELMIQDPIYKRELFEKINPICYCGTGIGELKMMYDGTLINCQNHIYDLDLNSLPKEHNIEALEKRELVKHHYFANPLTSTPQELQRYFYLFNTANFQSLDFMFHEVVMIMKILLLTHQIDDSYRNEFKLIKHSLLIAMFNTCSYNQQMMTGSIFLHPISDVRLYANGYLDCEIESYNKEKKGEWI